MLLTPLLYFKTSVAVIDDDPDFVSEVADIFQSAGFNPLTYTKASDFFNDRHNYECDWSQYIGTSSEEDEYEVHSLTIDFNRLKMLFDNPPKVEPLSLMYVDYMMPDQNGLTVLSKLGQTPFQRGLLTGYADKNIAVTAFNQGTIHTYLDKGSPEMRHAVSSTTKRLVNAYFIRITNGLEISKCLTAHAQKVLSTEIFSQWFLNQMESMKMTQMTLVGSGGGFLFKTNRHQFYYLQLLTDDDFQTLLSDKVEKTLYQKIQDKKAYVLRLKDGKPIIPPLEQWDQYICEVMTIDAEQDIQVCLTEVTHEIKAPQ